MDLSTAAKEYESATAHFLDVASAVDEELLDRHVEGGWSARQVIHHLADSETQSYVRLRRLLAEPAGSTIQGYDEAAWADCAILGYRSLPIAHSLDVVRAVRAASLDIVLRLTPGDLERAGVHSESGAYSVAQWLTIYTSHPRQHAAQLLEAVNAKR